MMLRIEAPATKIRRISDIPIVAPATGQTSPLSPLGNGSLGAVSSRRLGGNQAPPYRYMPCTRRSSVAPGEAVRLAEGEAPRRGGTTR
jgi:hypothetical protein